MNSKNIVILFVSLSLLGSAVSLQASEKPKRPNIILILADDMGYADLGVTGSEISTPNLDKLAAEGLLMTNFYNAGRCCPTRASLLTGLYQHQAGVGDMTGNKGYPSYQGFLNKQSITLAEVLKTAGYTTAMTGKWHVGEAPKHWPQRRGFDNFYGIPQGGGAYFYPFLVDRDLWLNDQKITPPEDFYSTDNFSDYSVDFVDQQKDASDPFFLYVAYVAPHYPLQAREEDIKKYRGKYKLGFELIRQQRFEKQNKTGLLDGSVELSDQDEKMKDWSKLSEAQKNSEDLKMAVYAAQIESMDRGIGRIIDKLKATGQLENTLIMFLSDNGPVDKEAPNIPGSGGTIGSATSWESYGISWANASNTPFRSYKSYTHEGGIITPFIAYYPKLIKKPMISRQTGHIVDIMPTLLELAGIDYPKEYKGEQLTPIIGTSLLPVFNNKQLNNYKPLFWEHEGNRAVREGDWKLVSRYPKGWELYNLANDATELNDLSKAEPDKVRKLELLYEKWAQDSGVIPWDEFQSKKRKNIQSN